MSTLMYEVLLGLLICEVGVAVEHSVILDTICVHSLIRHMLATEGANHVKFLQFTCIFVDKPCPLFHFVSGFLIKLILIEIVFLLEFLLHLPDYIILKFEQATLLFIMLDQELALS
jgi:hypothetical protein